MKKPQLAPEEWDFREVDEAELDFAIAYEYLRENVPAGRELLGQYLPQFPAPWLAYEPQDRLALAEDMQDKLPSVYAVESRLAAPLLKSCGNQFFCLKVDFENATVAKLVSDFEQWARREAKTRKRKSGKASAPALHKLKALAAYRLARAGFTYKEAQAHVKAYAASVRIKGLPVLPLYTAGAWSDALKTVRSSLKTGA